MMIVTKGATDVTTYFHLRLAADGTDATGLTVTNMDLQYVRSGATPAAKADASALGAANSAHADNSAIEVDATDTPGLYRVDWPDAAFATGVDEVILTVKCATAFTESLRVRLIDAVRGLAGTALPNAAADAAGGLPISDAGGLDLDAQIGTKINDILTDTGTTLQGELDGIQADTEDIQSRLPAALVSGRIDASVGAMASNTLTAAALAADAVTEIQSGLSTVTTAQVNAEVDTALADIHLDHLLAVTYDPASKPGAADALLNELVENDGGVARYTANALEQAPTGGSAPTAGEIADAVWEEALADHEGTAGSTAEALADAGGSGASAADIADAVWDEATAGHTTSGTFGEQVKTDIDAILVDTAEIGAAGAGLTNINLPNQTMDIVGNITGNLSGSVGSVTGAVGSVTGNVGGNVAGSVASVTAGVTLATGAVSAAALAADAVDEILDEAIGDGTVTMRQALKLLVATQGGKVSGAATTTLTIRNAADSADVVVATVDADGNRSAVTLSL